MPCSARSSLRVGHGLNPEIAEETEMRTVGVDFDNTIVAYDDVMCRIAVEHGLIAADSRMSKRRLRDSIRLRPHGEEEWRSVQAEAYGHRMDEAKLAEGVSGFFRQCREKMVRLHIVSHKTETAGSGGREFNLRSAAMAWIRRRGVFGANGLGLSPDSVFFESTRKAKIARIASLGCTHFIDDLEETFLDKSFPPQVVKILYNANSDPCELKDLVVCRNWTEICEYFLQ